MRKFIKELEIGDLGETKLSEWCTIAGISANRSLEKDKTGWDHLLEFPYEQTSLPRDKQPKPIECKVQVKTTFRNDNGVNVKLSALKRLVDYTSPAFILFYQYENKEDARLVNSYLVHVDEKLITRVLKKIRANDISDKPQELHKIELKVSYSKKHLLAENSGLCLMDKILSFIPEGIAEYQSHKNNLTENVGYEEGGFQFQFDATPQDFDKFLLDSALGQESDFEIKNPVMKDNRFNLPNGAIEVNKDQKGKLAVQPNILDQCELRFKDDEHSPSVNFSGEFVQMPKATESTNYLIFRTTLFSVVLLDVTTGHMQGKLFFSLDNSAPIEEISNFLKVFSNQSNEQVVLEIYLKKEDRSLLTKINVPSPFKGETELAEAIKVLKNSFELDSTLNTAMDQILGQKDRIIGISNLIQQKTINLTFQVTEDNLGTHVYVPYTLIVQIGDKKVGVVTAIGGEQMEGNTYQIQEVIILKPLTFQTPDIPKGLIDEIQETQFTNFLNDKNIQIKTEN